MLPSEWREDACILLFLAVFVSAWYNKLHPTDRTIKNDLIRKKIILFLLQDDVPLFVRFGVHQLKDFANRQNQINSILWTHREQDAPNKNKKRQQWTCTSTTGVILEL